MEKRINTTGLTFLYDYSPDDNSFVFSEAGLLKVERILVFSNSSGNLSIKRILTSSCGVRHTEDGKLLEIRFSDRILENTISEESIDLYFSWFQEIDEFAISSLQENLQEWNIDTVQKADGSKIPLIEYVKQLASSK